MLALAKRSLKTAYVVDLAQLGDILECYDSGFRDCCETKLHVLVYIAERTAVRSNFETNFRFVGEPGGKSG